MACPISMREQDSRDQPYRQGAQANHRHCKPTIPHGCKVMEGLLTHRDHLSHEPCNPDTVVLRTPGVQFPLTSVPGYGCINCWQCEKHRAADNHCTSNFSHCLARTCLARA